MCYTKSIVKQSSKEKTRKQAVVLAMSLLTFFLATTGLVVHVVTSSWGDLHPLHVLYLFPITVQLVYAIGRLPNILRVLVATRFFTKKSDGGKIRPGEEPAVTIQICSYNEGDVVQETIRHACEVDWPQDKLTVQVCDDSTDKDSIALIECVVAMWRAKGVNIQHLRRPDREGYKAGNLRYHFSSVKSDYVAHFDADHRMEPDYLRRSMPFFFDEEGTPKANIGLVQSPWAYYNIHQNLLTETDTLGLDAHHVIEQTARGMCLNVFGFNGTGGVWRKSAIADAGGWSWETVTEDLALSYTAHNKGYDFVYIRDNPQRLESPPDILAHIQQKHRWTKGFIQVFRLSFIDIMSEPKVGLWTKIEAFFHITAPIQYPCMVLAALVHPILAYYELDSSSVRLMTVIPLSTPFLEVILAAYGKVASPKGEYKTFLARLMRLGFVLPYFALKNGMSLFESKAVFDGATSDDATFLTTPKQGGSENKKAQSTNKVKVQLINDALAWLGIFLALYRFWFVLAHDIVYEHTSFLDFWFHTMNLMTCFGLFVVGTAYIQARNKFHKTFLAQQEKRKREPGRLSRTQKNMLCWMAFFVVYHAAFTFYKIPLLVEYRSELSSPFLPDFSCPVSYAGGAKVHNPLVVFSQPRTGSNLFFQLMEKANYLADPEELEILSLYELFNTDPVLLGYRVQVVLDKMLNVCDKTYSSTNETKKYQRLLQSYGHGDDPHEFIEKTRLFSKEKWQTDMIELLQKEPFENPIELLRTLFTIPSWSKRRFVAFKMFDWHFTTELGETPESFFQDMSQLSGGQEPLVLILWRRRMIETYVSFRKAKLSDQWTTKDKAKGEILERIKVNKAEFESFISSEKKYYSSIVRMLTERGQKFEVFEYDHDLSDSEKQMKTVERLAGILGLPADTIQKEKLEGLIDLRKQSDSHLENMVENWDEIVEWGYGGETDEWEDIFADVLVQKLLRGQVDLVGA